MKPEITSVSYPFLKGGASPILPAFMTDAFIK